MVIHGKTTNNAEESLSTLYSSATLSMTKTKKTASKDDVETTDIVTVVDQFAGAMVLYLPLISLSLTHKHTYTHTNTNAFEFGF